MPVYEYSCSNCNHSLDKFQKHSEPDPTLCPECGKHDLKRQISAAAFSLKGTGWYVTDFKNNNKKSKRQQDKDTGKDKSDTGSKEASGDDSTGKAEKQDKDSGDSKDTSTGTGDTDKKTTKAATE